VVKVQGTLWLLEFLLMIFLSHAFFYSKRKHHEMTQWYRWPNSHNWVENEATYVIWGLLLCFQILPAWDKEEHDLNWWLWCLLWE
jgi:hypothetical protein